LKALRRSSALGVLILGLSAATLLAATAASAHVTVAAPGVVIGASDAVITFHVPDESAAASTVGLKVQLPTDHPIAGVLVAPMPGWTAKIIQTTLSTPISTDDGDITQVVSEIDWTAEATAGIKPGYFGQFTIIGGKLPDAVSTLTFKAIQIYSDKSVVSWIEQAAPGSKAQPDHPAPTLQLAAATTVPSGTPASANSSSASTPTVTAAAAGSSNDSSKATAALVLGIVGILLGAAALAVVLLRRRPSGAN
jgi:uncharacterized protein YcnI